MTQALEEGGTQNTFYFYHSWGWVRGGRQELLRGLLWRRSESVRYV